MTVGDHKYWGKFNRPCLPKYAACFPEEHYFATLMWVFSRERLFRVSLSNMPPSSDDDPFLSINLIIVPEGIQ